jgi:hypothetical protein
MESFDTAKGGPAGEAAPPPAPADDTQRLATGTARVLERKASGAQLRTTRGGSGAAAGATPKKAHRPSGLSRNRPAGKKPDPGLR